MSGLAQTLLVLKYALAAVPPDDREVVAENLAGWARSGGGDAWRGAVEILLSDAQAKPPRKAAAARPARPALRLVR